MKEGRKPEYPEKTPDDKLQKVVFSVDVAAVSIVQGLLRWITGSSSPCGNSLLLLRSPAISLGFTIFG